MKKKTVIRALGALESWAWQIDAVSPKNFSVTAEVSGCTTIDGWSKALKDVQSRHPLINAYVDTSNDGRLYFFHNHTVEIPLRVSRLNKTSFIEEEIQREFFTPLNISDTALLKAALLYSEERCVIILTSHHAIADGRSLAYFIYDVLQRLAGNAQPDLTLLPSIEDLCSPNIDPIGDIKKPSFTSKPVPYTERSLAKLKITRERLSPEFSTLIRKRAKQERTTVHGALSAAVACSLYKSPGWDERPVRICTPIDARKYSRLDYGLCFLALFPTYSYHTAEPDMFWDISRSITDDLSYYREKSGMTALVDLLEPYMNNHGLEKMIYFDREICAPDLMISNLGVLPFTKNLGELKIESIWGPNILIGTKGEQNIGVSTINDSIHLIHASYQSIPDLLEDAKKILLMATK
ncbi:condensation domain-containing protein [Brenneria populi]|uniref:Phthiocerol/phthiodiolone dimycocerosyl transferase n=1 Tax=Brenneria populi TaxID=1505588 RepID=A0ABU6JVI2_9GAMM|nr:condensation domain-containing protein [Brenneria populi Li et al. 2015]